MIALPHGTTQVPMMAQSGHYPYLETNDFQAVSLPYGGGRFSFYVFLPSSALSLGAFAQSVTEANWQQWMAQFRAMDGDITVSSTSSRRLVPRCAPPLPA